jgi:hypothetical protein
MRLGLSARYRDVVSTAEANGYALREPYAGYFDRQAAPLRVENTHVWDMNAGASDG